MSVCNTGQVFRCDTVCDTFHDLLCRPHVTSCISCLTCDSDHNELSELCCLGVCYSLTSIVKWQVLCVEFARAIMR
jgi:hypothetical protein